MGRGWVKSKNVTLAVQTCQPRLSLALCVLLGSYHVVIIFKYLISCQHLQIGRFHIKVRISIFPRKITRSGSSGSSSPLWCPLASVPACCPWGMGQEHHLAIVPSRDSAPTWPTEASVLAVLYKLGCFCCIAHPEGAWASPLTHD